MSRTRYDDMNCSVARSLDVLGDWWTLLIVRDAFFGARRFGDFERSLGIAKNVLANRLQNLVDNGIFEKIDVGERGTRFEYRLTEKRADLLTVLSALRDWGDRWVYGEGHEPIVVRERETGERVPALRVRNAQGKELGTRDLRTEAGPGANAETRARFRPGRGRAAKPGARTPKGDTP